MTTTNKVYEERRQVSDLFNKAEALRDWPGRYFPAMAKAEAAMQSWRQAHPEAAAQEDAERAAFAAAEKARREKDFAESFIGRGLD